MDEINVSTLRDYQLKIMDKVDEFCRNNNIAYYLFSGTLIGAIRHNGYIPWDDDIDIMMFRDDYEKFIDLFNKENKEFHAYSSRTDKGYNLHFCKISYDKTTLIETNLEPNDRVQLGINIDLFPIDNYPKAYDGDRLLKLLHKMDLLMYCKSFRYSRLRYKPLRQQLLILTLKFLSILISKTYLCKKQEKLAKQFNKKPCSTCSVITCHYKHRIPVWNIEDFESVDHIFEGRKYKIPKGYHRILTEQWGDYMKLPPVEQRVTHHSFIAWEGRKNG